MERELILEIIKDLFRNGDLVLKVEVDYDYYDEQTNVYVNLTDSEGNHIAQELLTSSWDEWSTKKSRDLLKIIF